MPLRDLRGYLWDVVQACEQVRQFTAGLTLDDYLADTLVRSATERQLTIVGEALAQAVRHFPEVTDQISHVRQIIAFRNRLVHAYLEIDDMTVWGIVQSFVPHLLAEAKALLADLDAGEPLEPNE
jgi:uncharacterized protein with HEPN domain